MIKIVHIQLLPLLSGVQRVCLDELQRLDPFIYERFLICKESGPLSKEAEKIGVKCIFVDELCRDINIKNDFLALCSLFKIIKKYRFDIVHTHSSKTGVLGRIAAYIARTPYIIHTVHGFSFSSANTRIQKAIYFIMERLGIICGDDIITLHDDDKIIALRDLKVNCKRIHVIPNGVDINKFYSFTYENKLKIREKEGFSHHDIIIGMLGRLWEQKNPLFLLRAFNIISKKFPNVKLVYIGDGDLKKDILECISYEGLTDKVKVLGWREDTEFLLNILDIFVLPSKWEGMPLAILEAQSVELPCLVSDIPGNRHIVKNNKTGLLFNLNNIDDLILNLDKVIINQSVRKFLGEEAREDVCRNHNIDKRIQIIHNLYQKRLRME